MSTSRTRPAKPRATRIFIASSYESRSITAVLENGLKSYAEVTPWHLDEVWKHGSFILQSLLAQASIYDFAVIVFGRDDKIISRNNESYSPRDNVIFEAGLFMAHLGHERTFIVAPKGSDLKILSDLAGLVLLTYDAPDEIHGLQGALRQVCKKISEVVKREKIRSPKVAAQSWLSNFGDAHYEVDKLLRRSRESKREIEVVNIALDMEYTWGMIFRDNIMKHAWPSGMKWRSLMVDSSSEEMKQIRNGDLSVEVAKQREQQIVEFCKENASILQSENIVFECRAYPALPLLHGFLVGKELHVGFCSVDDGVLSCTPYLSFNGDATDININVDIAKSYIKLFQSLFSQRWSAARKIWPQ